MDAKVIFLTLLYGVLSNALYALFVFMGQRLPSSLSRTDPRKVSRLVVVLIVAWPTANVLYFVLIYMLSKPLSWAIPVPISLITFAILLYLQLNQFWQLGIRGVDASIKKGINYDKALKLCTNELKFLGIGANKLTKEKEFEAAISRCMTNKPIKLLLLDPSDPRLVSSARQFNRPTDEYKRNVQESLRTIADLKTNRAFNIEVHFYSTEPVFRLMFIDDSLCLVSYYELGKGDGSQLPQIHVVKASENRASAKSLFHPLEIYFDEMWKDSTPWDFKEHLD